MNLRVSVPECASCRKGNSLHLIVTELEDDASAREDELIRLQLDLLEFEAAEGEGLGVGVAFEMAGGVKVQLAVSPEAAQEEGLVLQTGFDGGFGGLGGG